MPIATSMVLLQPINLTWKPNDFDHGIRKLPLRIFEKKKKKFYPLSNYK